MSLQDFIFQLPFNFTYTANCKLFNFLPTNKLFVCVETSYELELHTVRQFLCFFLANEVKSAVKYCRHFFSVLRFFKVVCFVLFFSRLQFNFSRTICFTSPYCLVREIVLQTSSSLPVLPQKFPNIQKFHFGIFSISRTFSPILQKAYSAEF